jgi:purine-binding chemotaxis protein CheW
MSSKRQLCTFFVGGLFLGVEVEKIQEVIRHQWMTHVPLAPSVIGGLINLRGQIVTAVDLRRRFDVSTGTTDDLPMNVVIRTDDGVMSLLVDEIGDVVEVGEDDFEPVPDTLTGVARELIRGVYKLKEQLLLLLDSEKAVSLAAMGAHVE